jgi:uroporphyrinogen decarboxylase
MKQILQTFEKKNNQIPIWLMRQAGRYLPEYRQIRESVNCFLDLCYDVEKAVEITLQPIKRYGFDAAIIFSDILVLPDALGWDVRFEEKIGPILRQFQSQDDFKYLTANSDKKLNKVYEIITKVKTSLPSSTALIGFAGSPWTVMTYLLEGRGKQNFEISKKFIYENNNLAQELVDFLTEKTTNHLLTQIRAGADLVQLFDSWAGILSGEEYNQFVITPTKKIIKTLKSYFPSLPIIGFPRGSGFLYEKYINDTGVDAVGVDQFVPITIMKIWSKKIVVQGNLDPFILLTNKDIIAQKTSEILTNFQEKNFIFNLGHGVMPNTPIENIKFLVNYIKEFKY